MAPGQMTTSRIAEQQQSREDTVGRISIERKLELLETRFTRPSPVAAAQGSRLEGQNGLLNSSPTTSHHSFSFDPPSGSRSSVMDSNLSTASNLPTHSVRSKRRFSKMSSLQAVSLAAERQMRKMQAAATGESGPLVGGAFLLPDQERSLSALASPPMSLGSSSNQTLLTSHLKSNPSENAPQVVAESPPTLTSPTATAANASSKPNAARPVLGPVSSTLARLFELSVLVLF